MTKALRRVDDFRMEFDRNDYSGEQQIIDTLTKRGKFIPSDQFDAKFDTIRLDAEDILFDADAVQASSLRRNAAVRPGWFWLPRGGLDQLVKTSVLRGFWREKEGLVAKKWERRTRVVARQDDFASDPMETGRFQINVTPEDADIVYVSESGPPDPTRAAKVERTGLRNRRSRRLVSRRGLQGRRDDRATCANGARRSGCRPNVMRVSGGYKIALAAIPRAAVIRATFDGSDPRQGAVVPQGEIDAPKGASQLRVVAEVGGVFGQEETAPLGGGFEEGPAGGGGAPKPRAALKPDAPVRLVSRFEPKDTAAAFSALDRLAKIPNAKVLGGSVELNGERSEGDFLSLRLGRDVAVPAAELDKSVKELARLLDAPQPAVKLTSRTKSHSRPVAIL